MSKLLEQEVAFVTGAASGIGLEIAKTFAAEGAKVVLSDLNGEKAEEAASQLRNQGYEAKSIACDVTDEDQIEKFISFTTDEFGSLDILVNNAGCNMWQRLKISLLKNLNLWSNLCLLDHLLARKKHFRL